VLNKIKEVQNAVGNDKLAVLKSYPELKRVLLYCYDPFRRYYLTPPVTRRQTHAKFLDAYAFELLDDLSSRKISGAWAEKVVKRLLMSLHTDHAEVFRMILNKDLRAGISAKTVNKVWPGLIPSVYDGSKKPDIQLVKTIDWKRIKFPVLAAVKKDGVRGRYPGQMISRTGQKLIGFDHIDKELENFPHELDGELIVPDTDFDTTSGLIRNNDPVPNAVYYVFDMPSFPGTKLQRYNRLSSMFHAFQFDHVKLIKHVLFYTKEELTKFYNYATEAGEEGIVIYNPDGKYKDGKTFDWVRWVPPKTADCRVVGYYEGAKSLTGTLGGIIVDYKGVEVKVGSGFKNNFEGNNKINVRDYIWTHFEEFDGKYAEIHFKNVTKKGSLRQPTFYRWRFDK